MSSIVIDADTSRADAKIDATEERAKSISASTLALLRRTAQAGILFAAATGRALDQTYLLLIESALITIQTVQATQAAIAASTFGVGTLIQGAFAAAAVVTMLRTVVLLRQGRREAAAESQRQVQLFRILSLARSAAISGSAFCSLEAFALSMPTSPLSNPETCIPKKTKNARTTKALIMGI